MKIRSKMALRYAGVTAILMLVFASVIYFVSSRDREQKFFSDLEREGFSKANLFFEVQTTPEIMHSIYRNNIKYIDEVEVAIYNSDQELLYHDAKEIDIVKETPELLTQILESPQSINFYEGKYQAVGALFKYHGNDHIITAAAYDGYGYAKMRKLAANLFVLSIISIALSFIIGYILARRALLPVARISNRMKDITANKLHLRLLEYNQNDEFGELANSFNKTLDIIESSFESQKLFVSNVSHELRTPLAVLIGEIDLALLKDRDSDSYKTTLTNMHHDTSRLIKLINGLLDLAKASYDEAKVAMHQLRIDEVLLDAREIVLKGNPQYSVDILFDKEIEREEEVTIVGNEYLLKLAFVNLIENNCKFSEDNLSSVRISFLDEQICIQFSDAGIGIPPDEIEFIYKPFFRGENKSYTHGNGIGMALVKRIIDMHKGNIIVDSVVGIGTSFRLIFRSF